MEEKTVWTIQKILDWTKQYFAGKGIENPRLDAEILLCDVLNCQRIKLYVNFDQPLQEAELAKYRGYVIRRAGWEPLAYILGHREFMDYDFKVTPEVLIPRPETELLVEKIVQALGHSLNEPKKEIKVLPWTAKEAAEKAEEESASEPKAAEDSAGYDGKRVLDIGTGSGAIIVSLLALVPGLRGTALDKSRAALAVARANAAHILGEQAVAGPAFGDVSVDNRDCMAAGTAAHRLSFVESDLWAAVPPDRVFDVIVSNPPYIPKVQIATLAADVQKEPVMALDGGADGLDFYRAIIKDTGVHLAPGGLLAFEIGQGQGQAVAALCSAAGLTDTLICNDYAGIDRMVFASRPGSVLFANLKEGNIHGN